MTVAVPFKKEAEMKREMKRLKAEKLHLLKKTGGCTLTPMKDEEGLPMFEAKIVMGNVVPELLESKAIPLFALIKAGFKVPVENTVVSTTTTSEQTTNTTPETKTQKNS